MKNTQEPDDTESVAIPFKIANPDTLEFPKSVRTDLSVRVGGGGQGVVISSHWVLTASHCVSSKHEGAVPVRYTDVEGKKRSLVSDMVIRHDSVDLALLRLSKPAAGRSPVLLVNTPFPVDKSKSYLLRKITTKQAWDNIPARVSKQQRFYVSSQDRKGKAGTSGSPWVIHSPLVGDVLVGITHGTGRVPQVGYVAGWIQKNVTKQSKDTITWATLKQALADEETPEPENEPPRQ